MNNLIATVALLFVVALSIQACKDIGFGSQVQPYVTPTPGVVATPVTPVYQPSTDATLSSLSVTPTDISKFSAGRRKYAVEVTSETNFATISAIPNLDKASIRINGELTIDGKPYRVPIDHGNNLVVVSVTAEDASTTRTYTVEIERALPLIERNSLQDFPGFDYHATGLPESIWSNGEIMWIFGHDLKLSAYRLSNKARTPYLNVDLVTENYPVSGLWSDGSIVWVGRDNDRLFAYNLHEGGRVSDADIRLQWPNRSASGIWSDGNTIWISDFKIGRIFAYHIAEKKPTPWLDIQLAAENDSPGGIWADGLTLWVADGLDDKLYAYKLFDHSRVPALDFEFLIDANKHSSTHGPFDIWSDGETMWVVEESRKKIFAYKMPNHNRALNADTSLRDLKVSATDDIGFKVDRNTYAVGVNAEVRRTRITATSNNPRATISIDGVDATRGVEHPIDLITGINNVYITVTAADGSSTENYMLQITRGTNEPATQNSEKDFNTLYNAGNHAARGLWSDGETMWVGDFHDSKIYAYSMDDMSRQPHHDLDIDYKGRHYEGFWSDGEIMWAVKDISTKLDAYHISNNERLPERDIDVSNDSDPRSRYRRHIDAWADGETIWIVNQLDSILHAHRLSDPVRLPDRDLNVSDSQPRAMWADDTHMWILDSTSGNIHAYRISDSQRVPEYDIPRPQHDPSQSHAEPTGIWSDGKTMWVVVASYIHFKPDPLQSKIFAYNMPTATPNR